MRSLQEIVKMNEDAEQKELDRMVRDYVRLNQMLTERLDEEVHGE